MIRARHTTAEGAAPRRGLGLSLFMVVLLAAIAAIRVPLHDLGIFQEGSAAAALLVFVPLAVWVGVALRRQIQGMLAPGVEAVVFRVSAFFSSLLTGTMVGAVTGAVAWTISRLRRT